MGSSHNDVREGGLSVGALIAVLSHIDSTGFHSIDSVLSGSSPRIDPMWPGRVRNAQIAVAAIEWPEALVAQATHFTDAAGRLLLALNDGDPVAAVAPSGEVHTAQHVLSDAGWRYLADVAGIRSASGGRGHQHPGPTP